MAGGVVGNYLVRYFLLREFPRGQRRTLRARSGFVAEDVEFFALRLRGIHRRGGGPDVNKREPAGVAVGQDFHAVANQLRPVFSNFFAMLNIFVGELLGGGEGKGLLFFDSLAGTHGGIDIVHGVDGINGGGPRIGKCLVNNFKMGGEFLQVASPKCKRALREAVGGGRADGAGAAHDHVGDGTSGFTEIFCGDNFELVREQPLFDEEDVIFCSVKGDGAEMVGAAADGDVHGQKY